VAQKETRLDRHRDGCYFSITRARHNSLKLRLNLIVDFGLRNSVHSVMSDECSIYRDLWDKTMDSESARLS